MRAALRRNSRGLRSYIKTLRQTLEPDPDPPRYLITEVGVRYRLLADSNKWRMVTVGS